MTLLVVTSLWLTRLSGWRFEFGPHLFEAAFNRSLLAFNNAGEFEEACKFAKMSLELYKTNPDAIDLLRSVEELLANEY